MTMQSNSKTTGTRVSTQKADVLAQLKEAAKSATNASQTSNSIFNDQKPVTFDEKVRKQRIANDNAEKDQKLKEITLNKLFRFLGVETAVIFLLAFLQGSTWSRFKLDPWSFRLLTTATLGQITAMLTIAVRHLFPQKK